MCGIFGAVSRKNTNLSTNELAFINNAMVTGTVRGPHGTGYVYVQVDKSKTPDASQIWFHKDAVTGSEMPKISTTGGKGGINLAFGHNRYATVGGVDASTAHPFDTPHVIGIHNGTLSFGWKDRMNASKKVEVDSEALMRCISHRGAKHALSNAKGAMAINFLDKKKGRLYMFRNSERPISYATTTTGTLVWASEAGMLAWLLERNNMSVDDDGIQSLTPDVLYDITDGELVEVDVIEDTGSPPVKANTYYSKNWKRAGSTYNRNLHDGDCECTVCGTKLKNESRYEIGYTNSKYHLCADQFCVDYLKDELGMEKIYVPTTLRLKAGCNQSLLHTKEFKSLQILAGGKAS